MLAWLSIWSEVQMICTWFAYGSADATATPSSLASAKSRMVYPSGTGLPRLSWKKGRLTFVCVHVCMPHAKYNKYNNSWTEYAYLKHYPTLAHQLISFINSWTHVKRTKSCRRIRTIMNKREWSLQGQNNHSANLILLARIISFFTLIIHFWKHTHHFISRFPREPEFTGCFIFPPVVLKEHQWK